LNQTTTLDFFYHNNRPTEETRNSMQFLTGLAGSLFRDGLRRLVAADPGRVS